MDKNTTKKIETVYIHNENGTPISMTQETNEALCSVELGVSNKGRVHIKGVKVYAATAQEAAIEALATIRMIREAANAKPRADVVAVFEQAEAEPEEASELVTEVEQMKADKQMSQAQGTALDPQSVWDREKGAWVMPR